MKKILSSYKTAFAFALLLASFAATAIPMQSTDEAPITFRAFAHSYSLNNCTYRGNIEAKVVIQSTQKKRIGELVAHAEVHASYARNHSNTWLNIDEPLEFIAYLTHEKNYLYMVQKTFTIKALGSYEYDRLRFQVERKDEGKSFTLPSSDPRIFYTIDISDLRPACDRYEENFVEVPVLVQCMNIQGMEPCQ